MCVFLKRGKTHPAGADWVLHLKTVEAVCSLRTLNFCKVTHAEISSFIREQRRIPMTAGTTTMKVEGVTHSVSNVLSHIKRLKQKQALIFYVQYTQG